MVFLPVCPFCPRISYIRLLPAQPTNTQTVHGTAETWRSLLLPYTQSPSISYLPSSYLHPRHLLHLHLIILLFFLLVLYILTTVASNCCCTLLYNSVCFRQGDYFNSAAQQSRSQLYNHATLVQQLNSEDQKTKEPDNRREEVFAIKEVFILFLSNTTIPKHITEPASSPLRRCSSIV